MAKKLTMDECLRHFNEYIMERKAGELYRAEFLNWKNELLDNGEPCSEVFAKFIDELYLKEMDTIGIVERKSSYKQPHSDDGDREFCSCDLKKNFIESLVGTKFENLGEILDYNLTVGDAGTSEYERVIDLLAVNHEKKKIVFVNVEYVGDRATLLKRVVELETFFREIDFDKFGRDYEIEGEYIFKKAILIAPGSDACYEIKTLSERGELIKLQKRFGTEFFNLSLKIELSEERDVGISKPQQGVVYPLQKI